MHLKSIDSHKYLRLNLDSFNNLCKDNVTLNPIKSTEISCLSTIERGSAFEIREMLNNILALCEIELFIGEKIMKI